MAYHHAMSTTSLKGANRPIDLRSDTVTQPTAAMLDAMMKAELGDDVYGDDPTTNRLEEQAAEKLGKEAGLLLTSGTQSNLAAVMAQCQRGEEYIIGINYHIFTDEAGGSMILGSAVPAPLPVDSRGALSPAAVVAAIKPDDFHHPVTRLLCIENTVRGMPQSLSYMDSMAETAHANGLRLHLDGARLFNAAIALGTDPARLVAGCDTVSICLSKGLGTPAGSILVGDSKTIGKARRIRKMLGGGMRQSGIIAAAGIHALEHHVERLAEDHTLARYLAEGLESVDSITIHHDRLATNMVFVSLEKDGQVWPEARIRALGRHFNEAGIIVNLAADMRLVTHLDLDQTAIDRVIESFAGFTV